MQINMWTQATSYGDIKIIWEFKEEKATKQEAYVFIPYE